MTPAEDSGVELLNQFYAWIKPYLVSVVRYCDGKPETGAMGVLLDLGGPVLATNRHVIEKAFNDPRYALHPVLKNPSTRLRPLSVHSKLDLATLQSEDRSYEAIQHLESEEVLTLPSGGIQMDRIKEPTIGKPLYAAGFPNCTREVKDDGKGPKQHYKIVSLLFPVLDYSDGVITLDRSKATGNVDPDFRGMSGSPLWQIEPTREGMEIYLVGLLKGTPDPCGPYLVGNSFKDLEPTGKWRYESK